MSRSYNKNAPIWGLNWNRKSEKEDKKEWHKKIRKVFKTLIKNEEDTPFVDKREVSNKYLMNKDDGPQRINRTLMKNEIEAELSKGWLLEDTKKKMTSLKYRSRK